MLRIIVVEEKDVLTTLVQSGFSGKEVSIERVSTADVVGLRNPHVLIVDLKVPNADKLLLKMKREKTECITITDNDLERMRRFTLARDFDAFTFKRLDGNVFNARVHQASEKTRDNWRREAERRARLNPPQPQRQLQPAPAPLVYAKPRPAFVPAH